MLNTTLLMLHALGNECEPPTPGFFPLNGDIPSKPVILVENIPAVASLQLRNNGDLIPFTAKEVADQQWLLRPDAALQEGGARLIWETAVVRQWSVTTTAPLVPRWEAAPSVRSVTPGFFSEQRGPEIELRIPLSAAASLIEVTFTDPDQQAHVRMYPALGENLPLGGCLSPFLFPTQQAYALTVRGVGKDGAESTPVTLQIPADALERWSVP